MAMSELLIPLLSAVFGAGGGVGAAAGYFRSREMRRASEVRSLTAARVAEERTEQATLEAVSAVRTQEVIAERAAIEASNMTVQAMIRGLFDQNRDLHTRIAMVEAAANAAKEELVRQRDDCHRELVGAMAVAQDAAARVEVMAQELRAERALREQQERRYEDLIDEIRRHHAPEKGTQ